MQASIVTRTLAVVAVPLLPVVSFVAAVLAMVSTFGFLEAGAVFVAAFFAGRFLSSGAGLGLLRSSGDSAFFAAAAARCGRVLVVGAMALKAFKGVGVTI